MRLVRNFPTSSWMSIRIISNNCPGFSWIALNNSATSVTLTVSSIGCSSFFDVSANTLYRRCALLYTLKQFHTIQFTLSNYLWNVDFVYSNRMSDNFRSVSVIEWKRATTTSWPALALYSQLELVLGTYNTPHI